MINAGEIPRTLIRLNQLLDESDLAVSQGAAAAKLIKKPIKVAKTAAEMKSEKDKLKASITSTL